jgi:RNA polymerase sigma factor (sigma-70 family)
MAESQGSVLLRQIRKVLSVQRNQGLMDHQLLEQFIADADESAFAALAQRHAAMVLGVCRSVLHHQQDAEDVFQAVFLVLARKACSIRERQAVSSWLFGVAYRLALKARARSPRRRECELSESDRLPAPTSEDAGSCELRAILHEELHRLPDKYRAPLLLCYWEGRTRDQAAKQLGLTKDVVKKRLECGRNLLRGRLSGRGFVLSAAVFATLFARNEADAVSLSLLTNKAVKAALIFAKGKGVCSAATATTAVAIAKGAIRTMQLTKWAVIGVLTILAGGLMGGLGMTTSYLWEGRQLDSPSTNDSIGPRLAARDQKQSKQDKEQAKMKAELDRLQGTWNIVDLEVDGTKMADGNLKAANVVVQGDTFTSISMGATYKGAMKLDLTSAPKKLDIVFNEGPEKGNTALAIYELDGDTWRICLTVTSTVRPTAFVTNAGSGHALETLKREPAVSRQEAINKELVRLEGEWSMVSGEIGGQPLPAEFLKDAKRLGKGNETTVIIGGMIFFKAVITIDPAKQPKTIDYAMTEGPSKGKTQHGIYEWDGNTVRFCFGDPDKERPTDFTTKMGDERTLGVWTRAKK